MQEKIELYEEMLALEPASRLFFPLAEMLVKVEEYHRAKEVLERGLTSHPEFIEARLLLLDVLHKLGRVDVALEEIRKVLCLLGAYEGFWKSWGILLEEENDRDSLIAMRFMRRALQGHPLRWGEIFEKGCEQVLKSSPSEAASESSKSDAVPAMSGSSEAQAHEESLSDTDTIPDDEDAEEVPNISLAPDVSTKTMADLLMEQEEYEKALGIYEGLLKTCPEETERQDIAQAIDDARNKIAATRSAETTTEASGPEASEIDEDEQEMDGETRELVKTLSALADRLEQRAQE